MEALFVGFLNMSYQVAVVVLFILLARLAAGAVRIPKKYCCMLWGIPFIRMICPFTVESFLSLLPKKESFLLRAVTDGVVSQTPGGGQAADGIAGPLLQNAAGLTGTPGAPGTTGMAGTVQGAAGGNVSYPQWLTVLGIIWLAGIVLFFAYNLIAYAKLQSRLRCSVKLKDNVYLADYIDTPFVLGIIKPRIYLPSSISREESRYVLAHEQMHIRRRDHILKLAAFLITGIHWCNPFAWLACFLLGRDIEMACDEAVMEHYGEACKKEYARTLFFYASGRRLRGVPLAFSEGNPKRRIKNIMRYKKPLAGISVVAVLALAALGIGLLSNPVSEKEGQGDDPVIQEDTEPESDLPTPVEITAPALAADMPLGADNMILDYADGRTVIFHGYFGLFVYDKSLQSLVGAVDLRPIGCDATQGDNYCEVSVKADGSKVYLAPLARNMMYVYDTASGTMTMEAHDLKGIELFDAFRPQSDFLEEYVDVRSEQRAVITENDNNVRYGYLSSATGTVLDMMYVEAGSEEGNYAYESYPIFLTYLEDDLSGSQNEPEGARSEPEELLNSSAYAMAVEAVSESGITVEIFNNTEERIDYSDDYKLKKWNGESWEDVPYIIENWAFNQPAYNVEPGTSRTEEVDWEWLYGKLSDGVYLFTKSISIEKADGTYSHTSLGVQFTLPMQGKPPVLGAGQSALWKAYVSQEGVEAQILLATDSTYDYEGSQAGLFAQVYILKDAGTKNLGSISSTGTAYPVSYDESGIYVGGGHFVARYTVDEKEERLILAESVSVSYDEEGNPSYYGVVADDPRKEEQELTEEDFTALTEKYGKAEVVNFVK